MALAVRCLTGLRPALKLSQYRLLRLPGSRGPQRVGEIAAKLAAKKLAASRLCDRLQRHRLIGRRNGLSDRREVHLHPTSAGAEILSEITDRQRAALNDLAAVLPTSTTDRRSGRRRLRNGCTGPDAAWCCHGAGVFLSADPGSDAGKLVCRAVAADTNPADTLAVPVGQDQPAMSELTARLDARRRQCAPHGPPRSRRGAARLGLPRRGVARRGGVGHQRADQHCRPARRWLLRVHGRVP
ncbi:MarR family transcriptional regulator [Micromonospora chersina]|uniref:MarR family transcriptional regulator n=1 Tax=Micromonospora chersina TaxID=47854 RepID=UPI0036ADAE95